MPKGDTKTEAMLNVLGNGGDGDQFRGCCNTKTQQYILDAIDRINNIQPGGTNIFQGKTASFYGDSLTDENPAIYTKGYYEWTKEILGLSSINNYALAGDNIEECYDKVNAIEDTADMIFVFIGINNNNDKIPMGSWGNKTRGTTYGDYWQLCSLLKSKYPTKPVIFLIPHFQSRYPRSQTAEQNIEGMYNLAEACRKTCMRFAVPYFDLNNLCGIYLQTLDYVTVDGCHWNNIGHELAGKNLAAWVRQNVNLFYEAKLSSIDAVYTQGTQVVYPTTSLNDLKTNLVVTATYGDGSTQTLSASDYTLSGILSVGTSTITVTYEDKTDTFTVNVVSAPTLTSIDAVYTQGTQVVHPNTNLNDLKTNLVVTAHYSDSSSEVVSDYTLSGTLTVGTSTVTVTYEELTDTFTVTVTAEDPVTSITAVYTQGTQKVYTVNSLDKLRSHLVVTANHATAPSEVVTDYTLSGTLTAGTSTITASYGGQSDTFTVTVEVSDYLDKSYEISALHGTQPESFIKALFPTQSSGTWKAKYVFEVASASDLSKLGAVNTTKGGDYKWNALTLNVGATGDGYEGPGASQLGTDFARSVSGNFITYEEATAKARNYTQTYFAPVFAPAASVPYTIILRECSIINSSTGEIVDCLTFSTFFADETYTKSNLS